MIRSRIPGWLNAYRTRAGLWLRDIDLLVRRGDLRWNVQASLSFPTGERRLMLGHNLITDDGELHYAELIAQESPTNAFGAMELATATPTQAASDDRSDYTVQSGSEKAFSSGFPKRNDTDTDNTGKGVDVFTYKAEYAAADGNWTGLDGGIITNASPGASEPILTGFDFASSVDKDSSTALTVYVNHAPTGV
jgi:hypothetical protein